MKHFKISLSIKRFKFVKVCDKKMNWGKWFSGGQYFAIKNISFKTPILRSDLCHYSGA